MLSTMAITETQAAYLAGIIDGEGHIRIKHRSKMAKRKNKTYGPYDVYGTELVITSIDKCLIDWLVEHFGDGKGQVSLRERVKEHPNWKPVYRWTLTDRTLTAALNAALPYLVIKKELATLALKVRELQERVQDNQEDYPKKLGCPFKDELHSLFLRSRDINARR